MIGAHIRYYERKRTVSVVVFNDSDIRTKEFEGLSPTNDGAVMMSFVANQLVRLTF